MRQRFAASGQRASQSGRHLRQGSSIGLDAEQTRQLLQQAPAAYRTQVNDLLLTALARAVCRWSGQGSTLIQLEGHGREDLFDDIDLTRTVGWFTSLFPVRLTPTADLGGSIKAIKEQLRAIPDKGMGYGVLRYLGDAATQAALAALPQPRITFNYLGQFDRQFDETRCSCRPREASGAAQIDRCTVGQLADGRRPGLWRRVETRLGLQPRMFDRRDHQALADDYRWNCRR